MTRHRTYGPVRRAPAPSLRDADGPMHPRTAQASADNITRADTCDTRRPVQPLKGLQGTRTAAVSYRASSPAGERQNRSFKALSGKGSVPASPPPFLHTPNHLQPRPTATVWRNLGQHPHRDGTHTFSAKERDPETGYSYFGSRYYSSDLSVWLSVDPMSDKYPSSSPYAYCRNNPIKLVDPNGMFDSEAKAIRVRNRAVKKYGEDRVSDVYNNTVGEGKANYTFSIYGKGKSKRSYGGGTNELGGPVIIFDKADKVVSSRKDFRSYNRSQANLSKHGINSNSLSQGISIDFTIAFGPFGGSAEFGIIKDGKTNEKSLFVSKGLNVGIEASASVNYIIGDFDKNTFAGESVNFNLSTPIPNLSVGVSADINDGKPGENIGNNYFATKFSMSLGAGASFSRTKTIVK